MPANLLKTLSYSILEASDGKYKILEASEATYATVGSLKPANLFKRPLISAILLWIPLKKATLI